jgi:3-dehydro-L-gulonate 2-dehydrogenase
MNTIKIYADEMRSEFRRILIKYGFPENNAGICSEVFMVNTLEGISSHGVNRFPRFIDNVKKGLVNPDAEPSFISGLNGMERWNGNLGPGPVNALIATERAISLAVKNGIGLVALQNTNHWMRGGTYGWSAARKGFVFIGWTNTEANMPAWGATDFRLGNNPLVMGVPFGDEAIVLDFAMSQYSYGKLEVYKLAGDKLPYPGGFDTNGKLTDDPAEVLQTRRALPVGYWKGSGLSLMLDILAATLSGGLSTCEITGRGAEFGLSQIFIAIDPHCLSDDESYMKSIETIISDLKKSVPAEPGKEPRYPGENIVKVRAMNLKNGISVNKKVWDEILAL